MYESRENFFEENTDSDIDKRNGLIGNLHPYCCDPEKDTNESCRSDSDTNEDESIEEENVSPNNAEINRSVHKDWCICGRCKMKIREIDCLCCQEFAMIQKRTLKGIHALQCQGSSTHFTSKNLC